MTLQLGYSYLIAYSKLWPSSSGFPLQLSSDFLFVLLLRCIMCGHSNTSMNRMSVSSQECWKMWIYLVVLLALKYFHIHVFIVLLNLSTTTALPSLCVLYM